jgi:tetratricopeptide (TPR) repeat protein
MDAGNYESATQNFTQAIDVRPDFTDAYKNRGQAYGLDNQNDKAIADFTQAIQLDTSSGSQPKSTSADLYFRRASLYSDMTQYDLAIADYTNVIQIEPANWTAYLARGRAYAGKQSYESAISDFTRVIDSKEPALEGDAYYYRGMTYGFMRDYERVKADFLRASALPTDRSIRRIIEGNLENLGVPKLPRDTVPNSFNIFLAYTDIRDKSMVDELANSMRTAGQNVRTNYDSFPAEPLSVGYYSDSAQARTQAEQIKADVTRLVAEKTNIQIELRVIYQGDNHPYVPSENIEVYLPPLQKAPNAPR